MSFDEIISRCIALFSDATSNDPCCLKRYESVVTLLNEMKAAIMAGTYPRSYSVLPICHYVERNMDSDEMYDSIKMLDKWYADNYRNKIPIVKHRFLSLHMNALGVEKNTPTWFRVSMVF